MKRWKMVLFVSLIVTLTTLFLAGCEPSEGEPTDESVDEEPVEAMPTAARPFVFTSWGGIYSELQEDYWLRPWAEEFGIEHYLSLGNMDTAKVRAMGEAGIAEWDVVDIDPYAVLLLGDYLEPIDYSIVNTDGLMDEHIWDHMVGNMTYSTVIAWNTDAFPPGMEPETWADFYDVERFPGPRTLYNSAWNNIEFALLADGVPIDEVYPLTEEKVDRAFAKLDEIKPHVTFWWEAGAQPAQLLADGEVYLATGWNGRFAAVMAEGAPVNLTYNQALMEFQGLGVIKGSPYKELAMHFINYAISAEPNAALQYLNYGPINAKSYDYIDDEIARTLNTYPDNAKLQLVLDDEWWAENYDEMQERWDSWLLE